jgi:sterol desaturase/sphingolipid hydroxylase (fatty acid hydroxylase superfamily)
MGWLERFLAGTADFLMGPIATGGRFHWLGLVAGVTIAFVAFRLAAGSQTRADGFLRFCFPRGVYAHKSTLVDWQIAYANFFFGHFFNVTWRISTAMGASLVTSWLTAIFGPVAHGWAWSAPVVVFYALVISLLSDLGYFLFHWASHVFPPLWSFHRVHHSAEVMTPLTAARVHPLERAVLGPVRAVVMAPAVGLVIYLFAGETAAPVLLALDLFSLIFFALGHVLHHSHIWVYYGPIVGRVIVSPAQHQIHHSSAPRHWDRNFAEHWSLWDALFGTIYLPKERETLSFGLAGVARQPHPGVVSAYARPFWDAAVESWKLAGRIGRHLPGRPGRAAAEIVPAAEAGGE